MMERKHLSRNVITYAGASLALIAFVLGVVLIIADFLLQPMSPYNSLVTYLLIPMAIGGGLVLALIGILIEWRRRRKERPEESHLPVVDLNRPRVRRKFVITLVVITVFFGVSTVGTYRAFVFTESNQFCGTICHAVMEPEYTAYQHSPHARVHCVECHIGRGAEWYVRSKIDGLRQVYRTIMKSYELPIQAPIRNLRPARETCEHCHWPEKFAGTIERVRWYFWNDEENTPSRYHILMKVGGANRETGEAHGIHWHTSSREIVRYWPKDRERLEIPWVEVRHADGTRTVYRNDDAPSGRPPEDEMRTMDCIDCHNRPSHIYRTPEEMVNRALAAGTLNRHIPWIKETSVDLLSDDYPDREAAFTAIREGVLDTYEGEEEGRITQADLDQAVSVLTGIFGQTHFPRQGVNWKTYPDHIGHRAFPGCFRCHDNEHLSDGGASISMECAHCHDFVFQAHGEDAYGPVTYETLSFEHPGGMEDVWEDALCTECHAPE